MRLEAYLVLAAALFCVGLFGDCTVACTGDDACDEVTCVAPEQACEIDCGGDNACVGGVECDSRSGSIDCSLRAD